MLRGVKKRRATLGRTSDHREETKVDFVERPASKYIGSRARP